MSKCHNFAAQSCLFLFTGKSYGLSLKKMFMAKTRRVDAEER